MDKRRIDEILESKGAIDVTYNDDPVWLEPIGPDKNGAIQVKNLMTNELMTVAIRDLKEIN